MSTSATAKTQVKSAQGVPAKPDTAAKPVPASPEKEEREVKSTDKVAEYRQTFEQGEYPYTDKMGRKEYEAQKAMLQAELLKVQHWAQEANEKFVLIFEGRDAAGKGGTIKRFTEHLNPRQARVVALNKPT